MNELFDLVTDMADLQAGAHGHQQISFSKTSDNDSRLSTGTLMDDDHDHQSSEPSHSSNPSQPG